MSPEPQALKKFHRALHGWYERHGRHHLPWRQTDDPYRIWVSEIMLQQTQVQTVLERYYFPFLGRFPSIEALAAAELQEVLKCWEGLGYYNRARYLHQAARQIGGRLPDKVEALQALPGIGRNTAHALAAFAYRQPVAVLEANVKRVVARIFALKQPTEKELWSKAQQLVDTKNPFDYNQAMMDLGAMICTPANPQCGQCPAHGLCEGTVDPAAYPQKKRKKPLPVRRTSIVLFTLPDGRIHISPRKERFLHGLWQFPEVENTAASLIFMGSRYRLSALSRIGSLRHSYSHFTFESDVYISELNLKIFDGRYWKTPQEIAALPLSRTEKKILKLLKSPPADAAA